MGLALFGGFLTGFITSQGYFDPPKHLFDDMEHWHDVAVPTDDDLHFADKHTLRKMATAEREKER